MHLFRKKARAHSTGVITKYTKKKKDESEREKEKEKWKEKKEKL